MYRIYYTWMVWDGWKPLVEHGQNMSTPTLHLKNSIQPGKQMYQGRCVHLCSWRWWDAWRCSIAKKHLSSHFFWGGCVMAPGPWPKISGMWLLKYDISPTYQRTASLARGLVVRPSKIAIPHTMEKAWPPKEQESQKSDLDMTLFGESDSEFSNKDIHDLKILIFRRWLSLFFVGCL